MNVIQETGEELFDLCGAGLTVAELAQLAGRREEDVRISLTGGVSAVQALRQLVNDGAARASRGAIMAHADRDLVASRVVALSGMGMRALARALGTTVRTLDRIVCSRDATGATYERILPLLEKLESRVAEYRKARADGGCPTIGTGSAALLALLNEHADKRNSVPNL